MKISRVITLNIILLGFINQTYAQDKRHEVEIGMGIWNTNEIINTLSDMIINSVPLGIEMKDGTSWGSIHAAYRYRLTERIGIGGLFAYDYSYEKAYLNDVRTGKFYKNHYTFAVEADYKYFAREKFSIYALGGIGMTLYNLKYKDQNDKARNGSDTDPYFTFQITPLGLKYGRNYGGFVEMGFGYRGVINAGLFMCL